MTTTETLAAKLTQSIADAMNEVTEAEMFARMHAEDRATSALAKTVGTADHHIQASKLQDLIFDALEDTYSAEIAANAASAALLGETARDVISAEDYATLTGRWFAAFEGK